jgi:hypothetical protein
MAPIINPGLKPRAINIFASCPSALKPLSQITGIKLAGSRGIAKHNNGSFFTGFPDKVGSESPPPAGMINCLIK